MSSVSVKNFEEDERLHIHLQLITPSSASANGVFSNPSSVKFTLSRLKNEELKFAIDRLRLNLNKKQSKKSKKKKSKPNPDPSVPKEVEKNESQSLDSEDLPIEILHNGEPLDLSVLNETAWIDGALLQIGNEKIPINYNLPGVKLEKLPTTILEGCPLFPGAETEFTKQEKCEFYWKTFDIKDMDKVKIQISRENIDLEEAILSESFTPQPDDVDRHVLLVCIPKRGELRGKMEAVVSPSVVTKGPGPCPFEMRHEKTKDRTENGGYVDCD